MCEHGCKTCTGNSPMKYQKKQQFQNNIDNSCKNQKIKRRLTVSQCSDNIWKQIVCHQYYHACKNNRDKRLSIIFDFCRRLHQVQDLADESQTKNRQQHGYDDSNHDARHETLANFLVIACSEILCSQDWQSCGKPLRKTDNQKLNAAGRANRCQCVNSKRLSDDNRIRQAVKLLKKIADKQRNGKQQD